MPATVVVYALRDPETLACHYVGKTTNLARRAQAHMLDARRGVGTYKAKWLRALGTAPAVEVLEYLALDESNWQTAERYWIAEMRRRGEPLTNGTDGGETGPSWLGRKRPPITAEHRENLRVAHLGQSPSAEARRKLSDANKGRKPHDFTAEARAKMAARKLGNTYRADSVKRMEVTPCQPL